VSALLRFPPYSLWETRTGAGTPVVLLHGLSGSSRWWSRNVQALAEKHLVAAVDLVGFGHNRRFFGLPLFLPSFAETTSLLARWLETFGEPVHLIGHSMGGQIAIALTSERPDLVRSLILVNAAGMPFHLDPRPHMRAVPRPPYGGIGIARVLVPDFFRAGPASVAVASARVVRGDMRDRMHAIRVPTLLVWGENDPLVPLVYGEAMQREIAGSRLVVIPGAAHVAMWDRPREFNSIALSFLAEVESTPFASALPAFSWGISGFTSGIAHRQAGQRRDIVLVHGLGMSSAYFVRLARELFDRGWNPIAPDIPGFGESDDAPPMSPSAATPSRTSLHRGRISSAPPSTSGPSGPNATGRASCSCSSSTRSASRCRSTAMSSPPTGAPASPDGGAPGAASSPTWAKSPQPAPSSPAPATPFPTARSSPCARSPAPTPASSPTPNT
jgi:pimeloyl-ACP methyl ester carboxylesterase